MKGGKKNPGKVYIVGAGPGDPGLLTVKGHSLIKKSDIVVYDRLVPDAILRLIPQKAKKIYAGKSCRKHYMTQEEINKELVNQARRGKSVVRLKGGDPLIFGRVGEEMEALLQAGIDFEIIPGVTSASGCAATAGIPLTHRGIANAVRFITGHQQKGEKIDLDWQGLADPKTTLVVYMGLANLKEICRNLIKAGLPKKTPAAAIQEGTTAKEQIFFSALDKLYNVTVKQNLQPPTLIIIGNVAALSPLYGHKKHPL